MIEAASEPMGGCGRGASSNRALISHNIKKDRLSANVYGVHHQGGMPPYSLVEVPPLPPTLKGRLPRYSLVVWPPCRLV